ncbi:MAG: hypothetical protein KDE27_15225, partial [Planctomycetes bacterium]|nr:hypothetical protein [Planctomycetota bacterium]
AIDEARPGPGALTVPVPSLVPGGAITTALGPGCGSPAPALAANGAPTLPNPAFALDLTAAPSASLLLFVAPTGASVALAPGCLQHVANQGLVTLGFLVADGSGTATTPFPLPANLALEGLTLHWQGAEFVTGGPVFANFALTNGIATRLACR